MNFILCKTYLDKALKYTLMKKGEQDSQTHLLTPKCLLKLLKVGAYTLSNLKPVTAQYYWLYGEY